MVTMGAITIPTITTRATTAGIIMGTTMVTMATTVVATMTTTHPITMAMQQGLLLVPTTSITTTTPTHTVLIPVEPIPVTLVALPSRPIALSEMGTAPTSG